MSQQSNTRKEGTGPWSGQPCGLPGAGFGPRGDPRRRHELKRADARDGHVGGKVQAQSEVAQTQRAVVHDHHVLRLRARGGCEELLGAARDRGSPQGQGHGRAQRRGLARLDVPVQDAFIVKIRYGKRQRQHHLQAGEGVAASIALAHFTFP